MNNVLTASVGCIFVSQGNSLVPTPIIIQASVFSPLFSSPYQLYGFVVLFILFLKQSYSLAHAGLKLSILLISQLLGLQACATTMDPARTLDLYYLPGSKLLPSSYSPLIYNLFLVNSFSLMFHSPCSEFNHSISNGLFNFYLFPGT